MQGRWGGGGNYNTSELLRVRCFGYGDFTKDSRKKNNLNIKIHPDVQQHELQ